MTTFVSDYRCDLCGGQLGLMSRIDHPASVFEHVETKDCLRVLASKLAQAQEDIRALEYRLNRNGVGQL